MTSVTTPEPVPSAAQPADFVGGDGESVQMRLNRGGGRVRGFLRGMWARRWFRWLFWLGVAGLMVLAVAWVVFARNLPTVAELQDYRPQLPTMVRDANGDPVHSYARERRVQLDYAEFPPMLVHAFLSAEDKTFFSHSGIDYPGIATAIWTNLTTDGRPVGASTITQQVAKNMLSNEVTYSRKIREAFLAKRLESALTKKQILALYLNEIPLGRRSFGVQAAARAYFDKDVADLALHEMAFLAILPKSPETYGRPRYEAKALARRNFVLDQMVANEWVTPSAAAAAKSMPLGYLETSGNALPSVGGYYMEEVRRLLIETFGETADKGPNSVYAGGLWVRTPFDAPMQAAATRALRGGLQRYDAGKGWSGPIATIEADDQWASRLASSFKTIDYDNWRVAVVLKKSGNSAEIGFADGTTGTLPANAAQMIYRKAGTSAFAAMKPGHLITVKSAGGKLYVLRSVPEVSGGMIVQSTHNGRVYAMQGGFDAGLSSFNRATQAERQPGSTIKPFVYAAAMDNGMTPASIVVDGSFCVYQGAKFGRKCFTNFGGSSGAGPQTIRWGLEQSRNLMTVRIANTIGMKHVVDTIRAMGIGEHEPYLSTALGAGSTTVMKLTNAYAMLVNHGRELKPHVIDYVQDRNGKVIWPAKWKPCDGCNADDWDGRAMPRFDAEGKQVMDAMTAYQTVHMLEGVVTRGTAVTLADLPLTLFGKTGTTTGPKDVWFVGGSADIVAGTYMGFDDPRDMGAYAQGGSLAAPMFKQFASLAMSGGPDVPFPAPNGVRMVRVDRKTGRRVYGSWPGDDPKGAVIWEAFKPSTEPKRSIRQDELDQRAPAKTTRRSTGTTSGTTQAPRRDTGFLEEQGGIY